MNDFKPVRVCSRWTLNKPVRVCLFRVGKIDRFIMLDSLRFTMLNKRFILCFWNIFNFKLRYSPLHQLISLILNLLFLYKFTFNWIYKLQNFYKSYAYPWSWSFHSTTPYHYFVQLIMKHFSTQYSTENFCTLRVFLKSIT